MDRDQAGAAAMMSDEGRELDSAFEASQSVVAVFKFDGKEYSFQIEGRGPSVLGSKQGDHVTAYALVKRGFARTLQDLELNSEESLADLKERRGRIYNFISQIAVVDKDSRDSLYAGLTEILQDYNQSRFKKSEIKAIKRFVEAEKSRESGLELAPTILDHMEREKLSNGRLIQSSLERMAETLMTFYNQAPNTAYLQIEGFKAASNEGPAVTAALNFLEKTNEIENGRIDQKESELKEDLEKKVSKTSASRSGELRTKLEEQLPKDIQRSREEIRGTLFKETIEKISDLFFYPEIRDADALEKHKRETADLNKPRATPRKELQKDLIQEDLISATAKHMHIVFAAFPELATQFDQDALTRAFVNRVITGSYQVKVKDKNETRKPGWPSICKDRDKDGIIVRISDVVFDAIKTLQTESERNLYSETAEFKSVESSKNPSSHVSSRRESEGKERSSASESEGKERGGGGIRDEDLQRQVVSGISDDDFMKELARRMGGELAETSLLEAVQREIEGNKVLDKESLVEIFSIAGEEIRESRKSYDKEKFDKIFYAKIRPIPELTNFKTENFLRDLNPHDNSHYSEITRSISERIKGLQKATVRDLKSIISEEYQSDHSLQRQQSTGKVGGRY